MRTYVRMVVCVHLPRFELLVAAGEGSRVGRPDARRASRWRWLRCRGARRAAPPGTAGLGEVSQGGRSERGEAGDGARRGAGPLSGAGAARGRPGEGGRAVGGGPAGARGDRGGRGAGAAGARLLRGGGLRARSTARSPTRSRGHGARSSEPVRIGAAPTRFCALACALAARSRRPLVLEGEHAGRWLAGQPVGLLGYRGADRGAAGAAERGWACARSGSSSGSGGGR